MEEAVGRPVEEQAEEKPAFTVTDKRFWVRKTAEDTSAPEAKPRSQYPTYVEQLKAQLEEKDRMLREHIERLSNENEAFRKRIEKEQEQLMSLYKGKLIEKLLPVLDNLERALASARETENFTALLEGIQLVYAQFLAQLKSEGVEPITALPRPFDPATDEAIGIEEVDDPSKDNLVLHEIEKGYLIEGRLLRPAKVIVGKRKEEESKAAE
ncbi:MAG: nucleotide exchange factor GrpE [Nitrospinota bacterium]|nr:MAG: nucleotide exchange factor GrpE [Nitrospinota bacterium]